MRDRDAIALLGAGALGGAPATWADLGCGDGTFTRALAAHLAPGSTIHAMDRDAAVLRALPRELHGVHVQPHAGDFTATPWPFADLEGILMANALHYVRDQAAFLARCARALPPHGRFVIVEYDTGRANPWVPYPLARETLAALFRDAGFPALEILGARPSIYHRADLYAALVTR